MEHRIITIGRQYGSGGREIGEKLAGRLGFTYYDTLLLEKAAEGSGLSSQIMEEFDEHLANKWLGISQAGDMRDTEHLPLPMRAVLSQFDVIRKIGEKESAVIVGRCADYVLHGQENVFSVFIQSGLDHRVARVAERNHISREEAAKRIRNTDKQRAMYYNYYTDKKWGASESYHLCIDSGLFGTDGTVDLLESCIKVFQRKEIPGN